jgi:hypothetical protein
MNQSLLIILLEVCSVARKYVFNPPKIRFLYYPKRFMLPQNIFFLKLPQRKRAPPIRPLFVQGRRRASPETAYYVFHRRVEVVPARPCALVLRRLGGLLPAPVLASESPGERGKQLSILDQGKGRRGEPNRCRRAAGSQGFGPAPGCEQGMPPGRANLASWTRRSRLPARRARPRSPASWMPPAIHSSAPGRAARARRVLAPVPASSF